MQSLIQNARKKRTKTMKPRTWEMAIAKETGQNAGVNGVTERLQQLTATLLDSASDSTSLGWQGLG
jgi:hypothetical protein